MRITPIGALGVLAIAAAAVASILFVVVLKPTSAAAFAAFAVWLVSPYAAMGIALVLLERKSRAPALWHFVVILVCAGGMLFLADVIFWHPDAQGAIAVLMAPLFQGAALLVLLPVAWALSERNK